MSGAPYSSAAPTDPDLQSLGLSHDLRAPLRVIDGFARILKEDFGLILDKRGNDHLDRILAATQRMNSMIDVLMGLAQLGTQPLQRQPVNLSNLAHRILEDLRHCEPARNVHVEVQADLVHWGDPVLLSRVMENLLGNAWKYSAKNAQARIRFCTRALPNDRTVFEVHDNGVGFDMRLVGQLFAPFQRLHSSSDFSGDGVGLVTVKRIIERHGGEVGAQGEPGKGSVFWFTLAERTANRARGD